jgi:DNA-binding beta-propeller fold protein YncE
MALAAAVGAAAAGLAGCATGRVEPGDAYHPVYPPPPARPRVIHRLNLRSADDLFEPSFFDRLGEAFTGAASQRLMRPSSVAVGPGGHVIVSDQELQGVHVFDVRGRQARFVDRAGPTHLVSPVGVAAWPDRFAVADSALQQVFVFDLEGQLVRELAPAGAFDRPSGLAYDRARDELYVVDTAAARVEVFEPATGRRVRRFGGPGRDIEQFNYPTHVFVDGGGRVYVTDSMNFRVQILTRDGRYLGSVGRLGDATGHLAVPKGVAVDRFGHIYVVDSYLSAVQVFDAEGRLLLHFGGVGEATGHFQVPTGLTMTPDNRLYVCDSMNRRVQIFEYIGGSDDEPTPPDRGAPADAADDDPAGGGVAPR